MQDANTTRGIGSLWISSNPPPPPPPPPRTRLHCEGKKIMNGTTEFIMRGCVTGHAELARSGDSAFLHAMGANGTRKVPRWWGTYGSGYQEDVELDADPGYINEDKMKQVITDPLSECIPLGMRTLIAFDSNCGQGVDAGDVCKLDGTNVADFFTNTTLAKQKRAKFIQMAQYVVQQHLGNIDMVEPLVEPSAAGADQDALWVFQEEMMNALLDVDPALLFVIGAYPNYQANSPAKAFKPDWAHTYNRFHNKIILTGNFLSGVATNLVQRADRVNIAVQARRQWNCPYLCQQVGTFHVDDPDNSLLDGMLTLFDTAADGPIGYTVWEELSVNSTGQSYGFWSLSDPDDPLSARVLDTARRDVLAAHFSA